MTPPWQEPLLSRLIEVQENECFVDGTRVDNLTVIVSHRIQRITPDQTRVTYAIEALGPSCNEMGPALSSDFPDVLKSLVEMAQSRP